MTEKKAAPKGTEAKVDETIETENPAVVVDAREGTTATQNRIDFNDPTKRDGDAVAENLSGE